MNRIRHWREERARIVPSAFTVREVAHRVGVSEVTFRSWEKGETRPNPRHAKALARELGVSVEELGLDNGSPED